MLTTGSQNRTSDSVTCDGGLRPVVLCADDYGLSPGVSRGIRELLVRSRISAVSCMVKFPEFSADGPMLQPYLDSTDIGLHFDLTTGRSLGALMRDAYLRRLDVAQIGEELQHQIATFRQVMGRPPDYIDGHRHIHLLPGIRDQVVKTAKSAGAYIRSTREPIGQALALRPSPVEAAYLSWSSAGLDRLAAQNGVTTNRGFRGPRTFREKRNFRRLFREMIRDASAGCLIMCHPGHADPLLATRDAILRPREDELKYLAGDEFPQDLSAAGLGLARLRQCHRVA